MQRSLEGQLEKVGKQETSYGMRWGSEAESFILGSVVKLIQLSNFYHFQVGLAACKSDPSGHNRGCQLGNFQLRDCGECNPLLVRFTSLVAYLFLVVRILVAQ